jgi:hypothetical protein
VTALARATHLFAGCGIATSDARKLAREAVASSRLKTVAGRWAAAQAIAERIRAARGRR